MLRWCRRALALSHVLRPAALLIVVYSFCTATVSAQASNTQTIVDDDVHSSPANAGLELSPVTQAPLQEAPAESSVPYAGSSTPQSTSERITIRHGGQAKGLETKPLPWYRSGLASLGLVLGVITFAALIIKRVTKTSHAGGGGVLHVLTRTHLSPKQSIAVVQMGGRLVFVGITPERISTLRIVEDREEAAMLRGQLRVGSDQPWGSQFDKHLSREAKELVDDLDIGMNAVGAEPDQASGSREDLKGLLDRLRAYPKGRSSQPAAGR